MEVFYATIGTSAEEYIIHRLALQLLTWSKLHIVELALQLCSLFCRNRIESRYSTVDSDAGTLSLLIQVVGHGTRQMSTLKVGDKMNIVYPLGHGFSTDIAAGSQVLLVGGGAGIAPLLYLAKVLQTKGVRPTILLGGRTAALIPTRELFEPCGEVCLATDDGSLGHKGLVVEHPVFAQQWDMIYTCGPTPMMKAVARSAAERGIRCEVSLENMMACGVGACLCCVTDTDDGHRCVCKEGPVFDIATMEKWYSK